MGERQEGQRAGNFNHKALNPLFRNEGRRSGAGWDVSVGGGDSSPVAVQGGNAPPPSARLMDQAMVERKPSHSWEPLGRAGRRHVTERPAPPPPSAHARRSGR
jgi:hypothetical protein